jgi:uncharacterized protein
LLRFFLIGSQAFDVFQKLRYIVLSIENGAIMTLINELREKSIEARKGTDQVAKSLMVTLYAECLSVGKNKRNGETTDDECISVIKKFKDNASETVKILADRGLPGGDSAIEVETLIGLLPKQLSNEELSDAIKGIISEKGLTDLKGLGQIMGALKATYGNTYDGKAASEIAKTLLSK